MKYFLWCIVLCGGLLVACSPAKMAMKKADKEYKKEAFDVAIDLYQKAADKNYDVHRAYFMIGESYRRSNRLQKALPYYEKAKGSEGYSELGALMYAKALKVNANYTEAEAVLKGLMSTSANDSLVDAASRELEVLEAVDNIMQTKSYFAVKNLEDINTVAAEYSPVFFDGQLYFTSNRFGGKIYENSGTPFTDIYHVKTRGANVDMESLTSLGNDFNDGNVNEGTIAFAPNGQTMVFAKGNNGRKNGTAHVNLYVSRFLRGKWSEPRMLRISDRQSWDSSPAFSADGRTLYFASNRKGGYGGADIYAASIDGRGRFGNVRNLGPTINTMGNEAFPHAAMDGTLFFSSDGHPGLGGLDLFSAKRKDGKIVIENLGVPVNSHFDDFGIFLFRLDRGFFTSNREDGKGDDDIYTFVNSDPDLKVVNYYLTGTTYTLKDDDVKEVLPNANVRLFGQNGEVLDQVVSGTDGSYKFRVYGGEDYDLLGEKPDYFSTRVDFTTKGKEIPKAKLTKLVTDTTFRQDLVLNPIILDKAIVLDNIYYDLDKAFIRQDAALELNKLVTIMQDNPEIRIELSSHTDSRADDDYNMRLSQRRADSAVAYIVNQGIAPGRIVAKGYGESKLLILDAQTEEEHQKNRRTEFKVTAYEPKKPPVPEGEEGEESNTEATEVDKYFGSSEGNGKD